MIQLVKYLISNRKMLRVFKEIAIFSHAVGSIIKSATLIAMGKPQIAIRIPPPLLEELNSYIERVGASKTDVVVSAIARYLDCAEDMPLSQRLAEVERRLAELETLVKAN